MPRMDAPRRTQADNIARIAATWPIAPSSADILERLRQAEQAGYDRRRAEEPPLRPLGRGPLEPDEQRRQDILNSMDDRERFGARRRHRDLQTGFDDE